MSSITKNEAPRAETSNKIPSSVAGLALLALCQSRGRWRRFKSVSLAFTQGSSKPAALLGTDVDFGGGQRGDFCVKYEGCGIAEDLQGRWLLVATVVKLASISVKARCDDFMVVPSVDERVAEAN